MPTIKIKEYKPCLSSEHNPPSHMVFQPGEYEHECPSCHKKQRFSVPMVIA